MVPARAWSVWGNLPSRITQSQPRDRHSRAADARPPGGAGLTSARLPAPSRAVRIGKCHRAGRPPSRVSQAGGRARDHRFWDRATTSSPSSKISFLASSFVFLERLIASIWSGRPSGLPPTSSKAALFRTAVLRTPALPPAGFAERSPPLRAQKPLPLCGSVRDECAERPSGNPEDRNAPQAAREPARDVVRHVDRPPRAGPDMCRRRPCRLTPGGWRDPDRTLGQQR